MSESQQIEVESPQSQQEQPSILQMDMQDIYFGSYKHIVYLKRIPGRIYNFKQGDIFSSPCTAYTEQSALQYSLPLGFLGSQYQDVLVPCIPAHALHCRFLEVDLIQSALVEKSERANPSIDELMTSCFLKVPANEEYDFIGFGSGKRSAIVKTCEGMYIRLKGCGNLDQGFPLEKVVSKYPSQCFELRGSQFEHTARRELFIAGSLGEFSGIHPLGFYRYGEDHEGNPQIVQTSQQCQKQVDCENPIKPCSFHNAVPVIAKYCTVYRTLGEKRLSTHLLQGIEILLRVALQQIGKEDISCYEKLLQKYKRCSSERLTYLTESKDSIPEVDTNLMHYLEVSQRSDISSIGGVFSDEDEKMYVNLFEEDNEQNNKEIQQGGSVDFTEILAKLNISSSYSNLLSQAIQQVNNSSSTTTITFSDFFALLGDLYSILGGEIGETMRRIYEVDLNWGYFADHDTAYHCNAHPNNFVVLPRGNGRLLAPLDFDMAFYRKEYIMYSHEKKKQSENEVETQDAVESMTKDAQFNQYMELSRQSLELALNGVEIMCNFKFNTVEQNENKIGSNVLSAEEMNRLFEFYRVALRDTLRVHYMRGFEGTNSKNNKSNNQAAHHRIADLANDNTSEKIKRIHGMIQIALIITADEMS